MSGSHSSLAHGATFTPKDGGSQAYALNRSIHPIKQGQTGPLLSSFHPHPCSRLVPNTVHHLRAGEGGRGLGEGERGSSEEQQ